MKKNQQNVFGLLAVILAGALVFTGCSTDGDSDSGGSSGSGANPGGGATVAQIENLQITLDDPNWLVVYFTGDAIDSEIIVPEGKTLYLATPAPRAIGLDIPSDITITKDGSLTLLGAGSKLQVPGSLAVAGTLIFSAGATGSTLNSLRVNANGAVTVAAASNFGDVALDADGMFTLMTARAATITGSVSGNGVLMATADNALVLDGNGTPFAESIQFLDASTHGAIAQDGKNKDAMATAQDAIKDTPERFPTVKATSDPTAIGTFFPEATTVYYAGNSTIPAGSFSGEQTKRSICLARWHRLYSRLRQRGCWKAGRDPRAYPECQHWKRRRVSGAKRRGNTV
jgi:hypothetical protein